MGTIRFDTACFPVDGVPIPVPVPVVEEEPVVVVVEKDNTALKIWIVVIVLLVILILICVVIFLLRKKFHMREQSKTFDESGADKSKLILVGGGVEDSDAEIGNQKKKLVGDDSERHQFQLPIEADEEKHEHHNVSTKYGII